MILSFNLDFFGECNSVISSYLNIFNGSFANIKKYDKMPMAGALNINGRGLDMVWRSTLDIVFDNKHLCLEMSDNILIAMGREVTFNKLLYNPLILITHNRYNYIYNLFGLIYSDIGETKKVLNENIVDRYGIRWSYRKSDECGIYYCLEFNGFCSDVIKYYENAFNIKATEVVRYKDSPCNAEVPSVGKDKIYSAVLNFQNGNQIYPLKLSDSIESALTGSYGYDPNALLFYKNKYNPIFTLRDKDAVYLSDSFNKLAIGSKLNKSFSQNEEGVLSGSLIDKYGICWNFVNNINDF